jgi:hypothetical protein
MRGNIGMDHWTRVNERRFEENRKFAPYQVSESNYIFSAVALEKK